MPQNSYALLTNPLYIGKIRHKSDLYQGEHESIVEAEVFEKVQATLQRNGRSGGVMVRNRYGALLKGLLFCKGCSRAMTHSFTCKGERRYRYYTCTRAIKNGRKACPSGSLPAFEIERVVGDQIRGIAADPGLRAEFLRQAQEQFDVELAELATEQRGLEQELAWHHADIGKICGDGPATAPGGARLAELNDRVAQAETRLAELRHRIEEHERDQLDVGDIDAAFADFDNVWNALSPREQAQVLALLVGAGRVRCGRQHGRGFFPRHGHQDLGTSEARRCGMITVKKQVFFTRSKRGRRRIEDNPPASQTVPPGRVPRVSRVMALAIQFDDLLRSGTVSDTIELARLAKVTQPRITQVMNLLHLAPDIQEELLFLPLVTHGRDPINKKRLRRICADVSWNRQRQQWAFLRKTTAKQQNQ